MGLLDAYQDSTDRALTVMAARPIDPEPPKPKHSGWSTIPRAVAGAFVETAGNIMDVASAYGQVQAATGANANPLIPGSPEDRKQRLEAYDKLKADGIDWQPEESRPHYQMARDLRPDPLTAGAAENIVFGLTKGLTKAIGAGMIAGPVAGAGAFGVSEGMTTAEDLAAQGVDPATRQKVGVLTGAVSAAGMALPVAGSTLAKTAALVAVGGPASFIAQQAATRAILENADYGKLAQQYDPLDPVGLALATLLPAGFATWAKAGAISAAMKGKPKVVSDPAKVVTAEDSSVVAPSRPVATQDQVDAAMVHNLTIARDAVDEVGPAPFVKVMEEAAKVRPAVIDGVQEISTQGLAVRMEDLRIAEENLAAGKGSVTPDAPVDVTYNVDTGVYSLSDGYHRYLKARGGTIEAALQQANDGNYPAMKADVKLVKNDTINGFAAERPLTDAERGVYQKVGADATAANSPAVVKEWESGKPTNPLATMRVSEEVATVASGVATRVATSSEVAKPAHKDPHIASILARAEDLKAQSPDMPVAVREDGTPVTLAEELDSIRRQAREGTADTFGADDAPLIQVAVECMLSMGAA